MKSNACIRRVSASAPPNPRSTPNAAACRPRTIESKSTRVSKYVLDYVSPEAELPEAPPVARITVLLFEELEEILPISFAEGLGVASKEQPEDSFSGGHMGLASPSRSSVRAYRTTRSSCLSSRRRVWRPESVNAKYRRRNFSLPDVAFRRDPIDQAFSLEALDGDVESTRAESDAALGAALHVQLDTVPVPRFFSQSQQDVELDRCEFRTRHSR